MNNEERLRTLGEQAKRESLKRFEQLFADLRLHQNFLLQQENPSKIDKVKATQELWPLWNTLESRELDFEDLPQDIQDILQEFDLLHIFPRVEKVARVSDPVLKNTVPPQGDASPNANIERRHRSLPSVLALDGMASFLSENELEPMRLIIAQAYLLETDSDDPGVQITPSHLEKVIVAMQRLGFEVAELPREFVRALKVLHMEAAFLQIREEQAMTIDGNSLGGKLQKLSTSDHSQFLRIAYTILYLGETGDLHQSGQLRLPPSDLNLFGRCLHECSISSVDLGVRINFALEKLDLKQFLV